jgi:DNA polymerase I
MTVGRSGACGTNDQKTVGGTEDQEAKRQERITGSFFDTGWDATPGIVSVWADGTGRAAVWRRIRDTGALVREDVRFRPWLLLDRLDDVRQLGARLAPDQGARTPAGLVTYRELRGSGALRYLVRADDLRTLRSAVLQGASRRIGHPIEYMRELGKECVLALPPDEQYLVASGRTYFRDLSFDDLHRMQIDLETTGLDSERDRVFMAAVRDHDGSIELIEARGEGDGAEADLIRRLVARVHAADPDVIENHNLHGFDLPFLDRRARILGVPLALGRIGPGLRERGPARAAGGAGP